MYEKPAAVVAPPLPWPFGPHVAGKKIQDYTRTHYWVL